MKDCHCGKSNRAALPALAPPLVLVLGLLLSACHASNDTTSTSKSTNSADTTTLEAPDYGVELHYDPSLRDPSLRGSSPEHPNASSAQAGGYFDNGSWQVDDSAAGETLITLTLPGSNEITTGLWRLGASKNADAIERCLALPANAQPADDATIDGRAFRHFTLGDAGMSHFQQIQGYRAVIDDACYAIDLIVQGTRGDVYDPPREAPFTMDDAMSRLAAISDGLRLPAGQ